MAPLNLIVSDVTVSSRIMLLGLVGFFFFFYSGGRGFKIINLKYDILD